jgi:hypothetical protein
MLAESANSGNTSIVTEHQTCPVKSVTICYAKKPASVKSGVKKQKSSQAEAIERRTYKFIDNIVNTLYEKLSKSAFAVFEKSDGSIYRSPVMAARGSRKYAMKQYRRLQDIQWRIDQLVKTKPDTTETITHIKDDKTVISVPRFIETSALFTTVTKSYDYTNIESIVKCWKDIHGGLPKFCRKFKNKKMIKALDEPTAYVHSMEGHRNGGGHAHVLMLFSNLIRCENRWSEKEQNFVLRVSDETRDEIKRAWNTSVKEKANIDVRGTSTSAIASYLMKELGKANHVEGAVRRWIKRREAGTGIDEINSFTGKKKKQFDDDCKKIWAYGHAIASGYNLLQTSRSLPKEMEMTEEEKKRREERLDYVENNSTKTEGDIIKVLYVPAGALQGMQPYCGKVEETDQDYGLLSGLVRGHTPLPDRLQLFDSLQEWKDWLASLRQRQKADETRKGHHKENLDYYLNRLLNFATPVDRHV